MEQRSEDQEDRNGEDEPKLKKTMDAFGQLGQDCKTLLTLFYFDKKPLKVIAEKLQIGNASARNKKYRCMQRLRELAIAENR